MTTTDTPKSENHWEMGTHFCILCYPSLEMKSNRKKTRVELTASTLKCLHIIPVSQRISDIGVSILATTLLQETSGLTDSYNTDSSIGPKLKTKIHLKYHNTDTLACTPILSPTASPLQVLFQSLARSFVLWSAPGNQSIVSQTTDTVPLVSL